MNFELFITKRVISRQPRKKKGARSLVRISIVAIGLSLSIMILAVAILTGFKIEIKHKLSGFSAHIQITRLDSNNSFESPPITKNPKLFTQLKRFKPVAVVYPFATKPALFKSGTDIQGVMLTGVDTSYSWNFFKEYLIDGTLPDYHDTTSLGILISSTIANHLHLHPGSRIPTYFIQDPPALRPFVVSGIYQTGLEEYDHLYAYCHLSHIRKINHWSSNQIGGYGIMLHHPDQYEQVADQIRSITTAINFNRQEMLEVHTIRDLAPGFFDFLRLTDMNVWVILVLMVLVAGFNMISGLLILILDRTRMIGTLRTMGARTGSLRKIFLYYAAIIIGEGLLLGNFLGIGIALIQYYYHIIPLDPASYFVDHVPIRLNLIWLLALNAGTLIITLAMLLIPSGIISRLSPDKTIKFD